MELFTSKISFSNKDKLVNITLPNQLNEYLAEFVGIVVGDGHLNYEVREKSRFYSITISCNLITKYKMWKKFGFCPPNTTLRQHLVFLSGDKLNAPGRI